MFSPIIDPAQRDVSQGMADQRDTDAQYEAESELVMKERILPWLHLVHSITPGASVILVCSHLESPPPGYGGSDAEWIAHVRRLAACVYDKVCLRALT